MNTPRILFAIVLTVLLAACRDAAPEKHVHRILIERMQTLALAESCTGGSIAARFTALPGASAYFTCGIVAYSIRAKNNLLGVSGDTIARYGTVSEQVVRQMADGVRRSAGTHYAIATTGIAGPTGGTPETPRGTVWIAVSSPLHTVTRLIRARGDRHQVIQEAGTAAIELLEETLQEE